MAQTIKQAQAELRKVKKASDGILEANCKLLKKVEVLDELVDVLEELGGKYEDGRIKLKSQVRGLESQVEQLQANEDLLNEDYISLKIEKTALINKNEAMQSIMDSMAHLATAGQALIEL